MKIERERSGPPEILFDTVVSPYSINMLLDFEKRDGAGTFKNVDPLKPYTDWLRSKNSNPAFATLSDVFTAGKNGFQTNTFPSLANTMFLMDPKDHPALCDYLSQDSETQYQFSDNSLLRTYTLWAIQNTSREHRNNPYEPVFMEIHPELGKSCQQLFADRTGEQFFGSMLVRVNEPVFGLPFLLPIKTLSEEIFINHWNTIFSSAIRATRSLNRTLHESDRTHQKPMIESIQNSLGWFLKDIGSKYARMKKWQLPILRRDGNTVSADELETGILSLSYGLIGYWRRVHVEPLQRNIAASGNMK